MSAWLMRRSYEAKVQTLSQVATENVQAFSCAKYGGGDPDVGG